MVSATAQLGFIQDLDLYAKEKPYWLFIGKPRDKLDVEPTNVKLDTVRDIPLHDVRGKESQYNLEQHGFKFIKNHHTFKQFHDQDQIVADYLPQVEELIKRHVPYAEKIHIYDWRIRQELVGDDTLISANQIQDRKTILAPSSTVHTDSTEFSLLKRVEIFLPDEAQELLKGRVQMINFWRPVDDPVYNWPLVICDGRTVIKDKLVAVDQVSRQFVADVYYANYDPSYQWYYQSSMRPDEGVLFKSWDTAANVTAKTCIHSSTPLPMELLPKNYPTRKSVECRALVFSKNED